MGAVEELLDAMTKKAMEHQNKQWIEKKNHEAVEYREQRNLEFKKQEAILKEVRTLFVFLSILFYSVVVFITK